MCIYIPGGLTCWETCPDVYVEKLGKWVSFRPEMRELRDTQNECQIGQVPLCEYNFCKTPSIRIQLRQKKSGVIVNSYSYKVYIYKLW